MNRSPEWQAYHRQHHTSTRELAEIAARAQPGLLVLYHQLYWGATDEDLIREIRDAGQRPYDQTTNRTPLSLRRKTLISPSPMQKSGSSVPVVPLRKATLPTLL